MEEFLRRFVKGESRRAAKVQRAGREEKRKPGGHFEVSNIISNGLDRAFGGENTYANKRLVPERNCDCDSTAPLDLLCFRLTYFRD